VTQSLTLFLSDDIYRYLHEIADLTRQPVGELVAQSLKGNLPPRLADAPTELQPELLAMQTLPDGELREIAISQIPPEQQDRHQELLSKNEEGTLTGAERIELAGLRLNADRLMLQKAYAWSLLRWRGYPIPARDEIPTG